MGTVVTTPKKPHKQAVFTVTTSKIRTVTVVTRKGNMNLDTFKRNKCDKCCNYYGELQTRKCPHPAVNRVYGEIICVYCCKSCLHSKAYGTGWVCDYSKKEKKQ